jgi:hypothetical protein
VSAPAAVQTLLDKLRALADQIESLEATLQMMRYEQIRLRSELAQTGYRPEPQQELL